ncbi:ABC transporter permease [Blastococcus sp. TF02A-30]|uniref:ABC transporter permease n=1 Tax=Blastococcus sp. TF02A-30 TaxID=2250580 RepID=UPI000E05F01B|nr:ABC transporter permease [Blastococcus sp. TF02A-30]RBY92975.1 ABC transporter permease [Blastococcus sp. TF02A-30]
MGFLRFVAKRVLFTLPVLAIVALLTFLMLELTPGDPAVVVAGSDASPEAIEAARESLGLDQPLPQRFADYVGDVVTGDLGNSFTSGVPVLETIASRLPVSLSLTVGALLIGMVIALPAGIFAAVKSGSWLDRFTIFNTSVGMASPEFFVGLLLILAFSLTLGWFPATGYVPFADDPVEWANRLVLPALTLGVGVAAEVTRHVRASMRDVLQRDYIQTARAKGLSTASVIGKHGLKNAALPVVTVLGLQVRRLLAGTVIVEQIFAMNGIGTLAVRAVFHRDLPMLLGIALVTAVIVLLVNLVVDLSYGYLDPKVRAA